MRRLINYLRQAIGRAFCKRGAHRWRYEYRAAAGRYPVTFHLRFCQRCSKDEIEVRPFMGIKEWVPLSPWPKAITISLTEYEQKRFAEATTEEFSRLQKSVLAAVDRMRLTF